MPKQVQLRRATTAGHAAFTGASGEITFDTTLASLRVHDGSTAGGFVVPKAAASLTTNGILYATAGGAYTTSSNLSWNSGSSLLTVNGNITLDSSRTIQSAANYLVVKGAADLYLRTGASNTIYLADDVASTVSIAVGGGNVLLRTTTAPTYGAFSVGSGGITLVGASTIGTSTGQFDLRTAAGNGDIVITPHGTGLLKYAGTNTTGAGSAALGSNSPAITLTAPYTWWKVLTSDGSTGYFPIWK
jgi:hypothetical protein